jgi:hypothetical protein
MRSMSCVILVCFAKMPRGHDLRALTMPIHWFNIPQTLPWGSHPWWKYPPRGVLIWDNSHCVIDQCRLLGRTLPLPLLHCPCRELPGRCFLCPSSHQSLSITRPFVYRFRWLCQSGMFSIIGQSSRETDGFIDVHNHSPLDRGASHPYLH